MIAGINASDRFLVSAHWGCPAGEKSRKTVVAAVVGSLPVRVRPIPVLYSARRAFRLVIVKSTPRVTPASCSRRTLIPRYRRPAGSQVSDRMS